MISDNLRDLVNKLVDFREGSVILRLWTRGTQTGDEAMFKVQISNGPVGVIRDAVKVSANGRNSRVTRRFIPCQKSYLVGLGTTDVRLHAEIFETHDAAKTAIADAREDGVIGQDQRAVILCDD
jgi:hypothetical protein